MPGLALFGALRGVCDEFGLRPYRHQIFFVLYVPARSPAAPNLGLNMDSSINPQVAGKAHQEQLRNFKALRQIIVSKR